VEGADEEFAGEGSGYGFGGAGVEGSWEELGGVTGLWGCAHIFVLIFTIFWAMVKCVFCWVF